MSKPARSAFVALFVIGACGGEPVEAPRSGSGPASEPTGSNDATMGPMENETPPSEAPEALPPLELVIGTGEQTFEPLSDEQVVLVVNGPQGGSHIWGAFRAKGLSEDRARVSFRLSLMDDGSEQANVGPLLVRPERASQEGWLELAGLAIVLDDPGRVRGARCRLDVEVVDRDGRAATGSRIVEAR